MDIQSIYGGVKKTPAVGQANDGDVAPTTGFAALLDMVGSQFKASLGLGTMDPNVLKSGTETVRAPEPRDAKPRPERSDERDAKAKPAKDQSDDDTQTDETAAADDKNTQTADAGAENQGNTQQEAAQAMVAAVTDVAALAQTTTTAPVIITEAPVEAVSQAVVTDVETVVAEVVETEVVAKPVEAVVETKTVAQTDVKAAEKTVAPEAVAKDAVRVRDAINAYAPAQQTTDAEVPVVDAEANVTTTKAETKDVARAEVRSAAAQEQANNLARLLGQENRIQVQVTTNAAHTAKQGVADVSIYNIYAGYTAADAISLANGQFGAPDESLATKQAPAPRTTENAAQAAAIVAQAAQAPGAGSSNANTTNAPARAENAPVGGIQASASSSGASNANNGFSAFTQSGASNTAQTQAAQQANPTDRPSATAQHVIDQIKVNITKAAKAGMDRVTIQLKPVELGRIEIKLEMSEDHKVRVTVTADSKDTLSLLQNDSRALERTLNEAGLRTDANNLHFNLRSESDAQSADGQNGQGGKNGTGADAETAEDTTDPTYDYAAAAYARGGVDTFA